MVMRMNSEINVVYYKSSAKMKEVADNSVDLIITSPPYFNIKDYSRDGYQTSIHSSVKKMMLATLIYIKNILMLC